VDIGGGTPTRLPVSDLRRIANAIRPFLSKTAHPFPTSIETTPRICAEQPEKLAALRACGVDRVSLGVQSFNATTLASVNRRRQIDQTDHAVANLRAAGFPRINLDIIFALPGQSLADWKRDLERIIALSPDSVTTYDCLYRGQDRLLTKRTAELPSPETYGAMYDLAHEMLVAAGWHAPYGSVNFSRHSAETGTSAYFESRLLDGRPYLGLGNYATSLRDNFWSFNTQNTADYVARVTGGVNPCEFFYELPAAESQTKYALFSLNYGFIDGTRFARRFGVRFDEFYVKELNYALAAGWLEQKGERWHVKPGQFSRLHSIRSLFYSEPARRWLMALNCS
jgi:oxygen-independent coproporphyrinogen-3 oxidase